MSKQLLLSLLLLGAFTVLTSCSDPEYNQDYEQGYEKGYDIGYSDGYYEAVYSNDSVEHEYEHEYWMYENMYDYGLITLSSVLENLEADDAKKIVSILSDYYYDEGIYGEFVGEYSTFLLHDTGSSCFYNIEWDNIVLFDSNISYVLSKKNYKLCPACYPEAAEVFENIE